MKNKPPKKPSLSADIFLGIVEVFRQKGWEIPENDAGYESRFNRICDRLSRLDKQEQQLIVELTSRFVVIDGGEYLRLILELLDHLHTMKSEVFSPITKYFILPLIAPDDMGKMKSSRFIWYYFKDEHVKFSALFNGKPLVYCDVDKMSWVKSLKSNQMVILVDDYIGSGETATAAIKWLVDEYALKPEQITVLSIAAQEQGIQYINEYYHVQVYSYCYQKRGISDYYFGEKKEDYIRTMEKIEKRLKVEEEFQFGYNKTEALISLIRPPNNTFPVFWKPQNACGHAPFPRD